MDVSGVAQALVGSGPLGILILWLMYQQKTDREARTVERARRDEIDKDRIDTDKGLVVALTTLTNKIEELGK